MANVTTSAKVRLSFQNTLFTPSSREDNCLNVNEAGGKLSSYELRQTAPQPLRLLGRVSFGCCCCRPAVGPETGPDRVVSLRSARRCCLPRPRACAAAPAAAGARGATGRDVCRFLAGRGKAGGRESALGS